MLKPTAKNVNHNVKAKPSVSIVWLIQLAIITITSGQLGKLEDQKQYSILYNQLLQITTK